MLMFDAADAGLVIKSEPATASAQANDQCLRMRNPPRGEMILSGPQRCRPLEPLSAAQ